MQNDTHQRHVPSQSSHNSYQLGVISCQSMTTESTPGYRNYYNVPLTQHDPNAAGNIILREK